MMNFTTIVSLVQNAPEDSSIKGHAILNFGGVVVISDIAVCDGKNGLFCMMPSYKTKDDEYKDICYPCTAEAYQCVTDAVLKGFHNRAAEAAQPMVTVGDAGQIPRFEVRVTPYRTSGSTIRGYATVTLDGTFCISKVSIRENVNGNFYVAFPSVKSDGRVDAAGNPLRRFICGLPDERFESKLVGSIINTYKAVMAESTADHAEA